jgi:hypothetical protein
MNEQSGRETWAVSPFFLGSKLVLSLSGAGLLVEGANPGACLYLQYATGARPAVWGVVLLFVGKYPTFRDKP